MQVPANVGLPAYAAIHSFAVGLELRLWAHCCRPDAVRDRPHPLLNGLWAEGLMSLSSGRARSESFRSDDQCPELGAYARSAR